MIEAIVRYHATRAPFESRDVVTDVRDRVESAVALVCQKEQEHVDVSMSPYGPDDEHGASSSDTDILVKIDVDACERHGVHLSADDFIISLTDELHAIFGAQWPRPRVWVRPIVGGSFAE